MRSVLELQDEGTLLVADGNHGEYRPRSDEFGKESMRSFGQQTWMTEECSSTQRSG